MSKSNILILTEGEADITFLRDYFLFHNPKLEQKEQKKRNTKELILSDDIQKIKIKAIGGYTKVENEKTEMEAHSDQDFKIIVIQDCDNPNKNHGGLEARMKYLDEICQKIQFHFNTFLFPNNNENGDLETLLLKIVNTTKFNSPNECYMNFIDEEKKLALGFAHELENDKASIFNYFRAYDGIVKAKECNRKYKTSHWNFTDPYLNNLNDFFKSINAI